MIFKEFRCQDGKHLDELVEYTVRGRNGITALDACCSCGGGKAKVRQPMAISSIQRK